MPSAILSPTGLTPHFLEKLERDPVVNGMFRSLPDVVNILVCLDALPPASRSIREGESDGMDNMLASLMRRMGKIASVKLFSFAADSLHSEQDLNCAHIFWQGGGRGRDIQHIEAATWHNQRLWKMVQDNVCMNKLIYVGICLGAMIAGARCPVLDAALPMY